MLALASCADQQDYAHEEPTPHDLDTANGVAQFIVDSAGVRALESIDALRFTFGFEQEGSVRQVAHHLWDRANGRYRVEWPADAPNDSTYVGIFRSWPDDGIVYRAGQVVESIGDQSAVAVAERRSINDLYWLLAPLKVFDDGVTRRLEPDSASSSHIALHLSFEQVGLTPGDQYWLFADRGTGLVDRWTFLLQNSESPRSFRWVDYRALQTPAGRLRLAERKVPLHSGGSILTNQISVIESIEDDWFEVVRPRLGER